MPLNKTSPFPYGKYKGMQTQDVPPEYLLWFLEKEWAAEKYPDLVEYVLENRKKLEGLAKIRKKN